MEEEKGGKGEGRKKRRETWRQRCKVRIESLPKQQNTLQSLAPLNYPCRIKQACEQRSGTPFRYPLPPASFYLRLAGGSGNDGAEL